MPVSWARCARSPMAASDKARRGLGGRVKAALIGAKRQDLTGIENVVRIERRLDRAHHGETIAELCLEILGFALPHTVFTRAGALHGDGALDQTFEEGLHGGALGWIVAIEHRRGVEVAIADVTDDRSDQARGLDVLLRCNHAFGEA